MDFFKLMGSSAKNAWLKNTAEAVPSSNTEWHDLLGNCGASQMYP